MFSFTRQISNTSGPKHSLKYPVKKKNPKSKETFKMNGKDIKVEQNTVHLGIKRDISNRVNIEEKVNLARRTAYSLMGAGFHGGNGLTPEICAFMTIVDIICGPTTCIRLRSAKTLKN